jgi:hypothetical protein
MKLKSIRRPHTTSEKRVNADPETKQFIRNKRNPRNLANAYDDINRPEKKESRKKVLRSRKNFRDSIRKG